MILHSTSQFSLKKCVFFWQNNKGKYPQLSKKAIPLEKYNFQESTPPSLPNYVICVRLDFLHLFQSKQHQNRLASVASRRIQPFPIHSRALQKQTNKQNKKMPPFTHKKNLFKNSYFFLKPCFYVLTYNEFMITKWSYIYFNVSVFLPKW